MPHFVINLLSEAVIGQTLFVKSRVDNGGPSIEPLHCFVGALRLMHAGNSCDGADENSRITETVSNEALKYSCEVITQYFEEEHFNRSPADEEKQRSLDAMATRFLKGYFASWNCKHLIWDRCPQSLVGKNEGRGKKKASMQEITIDPFCMCSARALASQDY